MSRELKSYRAIATPITFGVNTREREGEGERWVLKKEKFSSFKVVEDVKGNQFQCQHIHTCTHTDGDGRYFFIHSEKKALSLLLFLFSLVVKGVAPYKPA